MLKLPKNIVTHPNVLQIENLFIHNMRRLHANGRLQVPVWSFDAKCQKALALVYGFKHLTQGLEFISTELDKELKGLKALQKQPGQAQNQRLSRLILLSNDGSERFYHQAESLLVKHCDRLMACIIDATADQLGEAFTKKSNPTKALLIDDRKALESFLAAFAE
jgi:hypothetical protein